MNLVGRDTGLARIGWGLHASGLAMTLAIIAVTDVVVLNSLQRREAEIDGQLEIASQYLERSEEIRTEADRLQSQLADDESRLAAVTDRIPVRPSESDFLEQITRLARSAGVRISEYDPSDAVSDGTHSAMAIRLEASASYESICRFLDGLESLPRLCRVTHLKITGADEETGVHPVDLTLRIYYASFDESRKESV